MKRKKIEIKSNDTHNVNYKLLNEKQKKKLEINAINKILNKLRENSNDQNKLNIESISSLTNNTSNKKINESNKKHFESTIRSLKNELQKSLESSLVEFEQNSECLKLNEIIKNEEITFQRRNEMCLMLKQLKNKIESLQIITKNEEKQFNSDCMNNKKQIISLKQEIKTLKKQIDIDQNLKKYELIANLNTNQRQYKITQQSLNIKLNDIQKELNREVKTFNATKSFLRNKLQTLESQSTKWTEKYNVETTKHKENLNQIRTQREETLSTLKKSQINYDKEKAIYEERIEAERKKKELEEKVYLSAINTSSYQRISNRSRLKREKAASKKGKRVKRWEKGGKKGGKKKK